MAAAASSLIEGLPLLQTAQAHAPPPQCRSQRTRTRLHHSAAASTRARARASTKYAAATCHRCACTSWTRCWRGERAAGGAGGAAPGWWCLQDPPSGRWRSSCSRCALAAWWCTACTRKRHPSKDRCKCTCRLGLAFAGHSYKLGEWREVMPLHHCNMVIGGERGKGKVVTSGNRTFSMHLTPGVDRRCRVEQSKARAVL